MTFSIKDFFINCGQIRSIADLVTLTEEILNANLFCVCSAPCVIGEFTM